MLEELFGNKSAVSSIPTMSLVKLNGAIVGDKVGTRQFKAGVKTPAGWLVCEGGQLRGAIKRLRDLAQEKGFDLSSLDVLSKADYVAKFGPGQAETPVQKPVQATTVPKSERSPIMPHQPTLRPPAFNPVVQEVSCPAPVQKPDMSIFAQLTPAQGPVAKTGRKYTPGRRLETCYQWAAALSDAAKRVGASQEGQRAAYKAAYVAAYKAGCGDGDAAKAEKFAGQVSAEFSLSQLRVEIERAGVPLAKLIAE